MTTASTPQAGMGKRRDVRRLAMQLLYQIDVTGELDRQAILDNVDAEHDANEAVRVEAVDLALAAWVTHGTADERVTALAPDWPTHRQPPVDRAILRLAHHEMASGRVPIKVAINEAVELSKQYCAEQSPMFVNGVLDKLAKQMREAGEATDDGASDGAGKGEAGSDATGEPDGWLADAMRG
ncbi:MAG: transcription antitermination factor NusB [Planctomycetota bacterium]